MPTTIPEEVAAAIRALVLPPRFRSPGRVLNRCPCQYGPCQRCNTGRHNGCVHRTEPGRLVPHTWITDTAGLVPNGSTCQVWTVGRSCRWVCTCPTCRRPRPPAVVIEPPGNPPAQRRVTWQATTLF